MPTKGARPAVRRIPAPGGDQETAEAAQRRFNRRETTEGERR